MFVLIGTSIPANSNSDQTIARGNKPFISFVTNYLTLKSVDQIFTLSNNYSVYLRTPAVTM